MFVKTQRLNRFHYLFFSLLLFNTTLSGQTVLFNEAFSGGSLPTGWTNVSNGGTGETWSFTNPGSRTIGGDFDANFVMLDSDAYGDGQSQDATLTTQTFSVPADASVILLEYDYQYRECCGSTINVELFNGSSWIEVAVYTGNANYSGTTRESIDIASHFSGAVTDARIRFNYVGAWAYWMAIDNFDISIPLDTDGDGIADIYDLDDDNDGIPDAVETTCHGNPTALVFQNHWANGEDPVSDAASPATVFEEVTVSLERRDPLSILDFSAGETGITAYNGITTYKVTQASQVGGYSDHIFKFSSPVENLVFGVIDVDAGGNFTDQVVINGYTSGSIYTILAADIVSGSANGFNTGQNSFTGSSGTTVYPNGLCQVSFPVPIDSIVMVYSNQDATPSANQAIGFNLSIDFNCQHSDADGDGILNHLDLDSDNDGIPDLVEAGGTDTNGDGTYDGNLDSDNDGIPDYADANNPSCTGGDANAPLDGICDAVQIGATGAAGVDTDGDGIDDNFDDDVNGDGMPDIYVSNAIGTQDSDGDGIEDQYDLDADNDGIPDVVEVGGTDSNGDGRIDDWVDTDGDGFNDVVDGDVGNDGIENTANALVVTGMDTNDDGTPDSYPNGDTDKDGNLDHLDLDADNDGIPDVVEAGGTDANGDGRADDFVDADNDGFNDIVDGDPNNSLALSDDSVDSNTNNALQLTGADANSDGTPDTYPEGDTDGDGRLDQIDLDADNDGIPDVVEAGGADDNNDGFVDNFDPTTGTFVGNGDSDGDGFSNFYDNDTDNNGTTGDANPLIITGTDGNGDGAPDNIVAADMDQDGIYNHLDLDADNDGIIDLIEANGTDVNGDGMVDDFNPASPSTFDTGDNDGWSTLYDGDAANDGTTTTAGDGSPLVTTQDKSSNGYPDDYLLGDAENDNYPNFLDIDADNDGIVDNVEGQSTAGYTLPNTVTVDSDQDGINDAYDNYVGFGGTGIDANTGDADGDPYDHNSNGIPDYLDLDSDGDNIPDVQEAWDNLFDGDSQTDALIGTCDGTDIDQDGLLDCFDSNTASPVVTSYDLPIDDNAYNGGATTGMTPTSGSTPDDIFPDNGGLDNQADWRDVLIDCGTPKVYYGVTEQSVGTTTDYELNGMNHVDGSGTQIVRATAACEPDADGWLYYFNPLEPENFLFAIRNSAGSPNTVPMWDLIDFVETKVEADPTNRHEVGSGSATFVMERDWNVSFKGTPITGSTFDVKFYFDPAEMTTLKNAADAVEANATGVNRDFYWVEKDGGIVNGDISDTGIANMEDITSFDSNLTGISDDNPTQADGAPAGNGKNYVSFEGISDFSGGTAAILMTYSALPVELRRFAGKSAGCFTNLTWLAESEEKFSHYELEWSGGGRTFQKIATIEAEGGDFNQAYEYVDRNAGNDNYYRLKMVDEDASFEYSKIVYVTTDCGDLTEGIDLYPNPLRTGSSGINVKFFSERKETVISIVDMLGRNVKVLNLEVEKDWNTLFLNISDLSAGSYYLKIDGTKGAKMFIVQE